MSLADDVREYCKKTHVDPARQKKQKTIGIRSGDVYSDLNYKNRYPLVCSTLGSNRFEEICDLRRMSVEGPYGVSTLFTFELK